MRKRILTLFAAIGIALAGLGANPAPTNADIGICGGNIAVDLYTGWNYDMVGAQYYKRFCGNSVNAISVPNLGSYVGMNNSVTSLKVFNSPNTSMCVKYYDGTSYTGAGIMSHGNVQIPNLATYNFNDKMSSLRTFSVC